MTRMTEAPGETVGRLHEAVEELRDPMLEFLSGSVRCASVSGDEDTIHGFLTDWFGAQGWTHETQQLHLTDAGRAADPATEPRLEHRCNIVAWPRPPRDGVPTVVLNGHIDVVPPGDIDSWTLPPFSGERRDGRVHGRGSVDTKGPIASGIFALQALRNLNVDLPFDVAVQLVVAEETTGIGTRAAFERIAEPAAAVVLEPTCGVAAPAGTGLLFFRIEIDGVSAHTSAPWRGQDAFLHLMRVHSALSDLADTRAEEHRNEYFADIPTPVPFVMGTVRAGTWRAAVPDTAEMAGRWGVAAGEDLDEMRARIESLVAKVDADAGWGARPSRVVWQHELPGWQTDADAHLVHAVRESIDAVRGSATPLVGLTAATDAAQYGPRGIPTIIYGPGDTALAHSPDESIEEDEVVASAQVLARTLLAFASRTTS
ncbi:acetylornithine deacetylase [Rhodococcus sp. LBL1]|nr:acetylornithine deacetylase [Rhodococcus sp. LBL1]MDH6683878.1 acetylornithine deacetylase [Rhodococcus sp. LBL2]